MTERQQISLLIVLWLVVGAVAIQVAIAPSPTFSLWQEITGVFEPDGNSLHAAEGDNEPFHPSADAMADVDRTLEAARANDKLALIVLGANWCHDSLGLTDHFSTPDMQRVLSEKYELLLVDVGYLEHGTDIVQRFGHPIIYGTPTVLVIDPETGQQVNEKSMHQWRAAASISLADTIRHFEGLKVSPSAPHSPASPELQTALAEIDAFENAQAARIAVAYEHLSPLIALERKDRPTNFYELWEQVRVMRYKITEDLATLRAIARRQSALDAAEISLDFPSYPKFDWE